MNLSSLENARTKVGILMDKTIIIVDDDDAVRDVLVRCLEPLDCSIESFHNGQEALTYLERKESQNVDLLIADSRLPGISGEKLIEEFRKIHPAAPALIVSGEDVTGTDIPVIQKPFSLAEFRKRVEILLGE